MDCLWIEGGVPLKGAIEVPSSKNASLPLMCLSLLTDETLSFKNLPHVADIQSMIHLLKSLGVESPAYGNFQCKNIESFTAPYEWVRKMRASILVLGPLLARAKKAEVSLPGGCAIGERPVDIHLKGLSALGAKIDIEGGYIKARCEELRGTRFVMDFPTVTGTINILSAAVLAKGETVLENCAREPEIIEVIDLLKAMGAKIEGSGTSTLQIQGVEKLKGVENWTIQSDRIQFLTYLAAAAITGGEMECFPYKKGSMNSVLQKFTEMGAEIRETNESVSIKAKGLQPIDLETAPFPGFPTDGQAQFMACLSLADPSKGTGVIRETVFESRFHHVSELRRLGAQIEVKGNTAIIKGVPSLKGAAVMASDLRASASLVLAGLAAEGKTQILRVYHLDRGYEGLESRLTRLGAKIWRAKQ